jgi:hypothetical protein
MAEFRARLWDKRLKDRNLQGMPDHAIKRYNHLKKREAAKMRANL